jgi:hypothetical protein
VPNRHIANRAELLALLAEDLADSFPIVGPAPATEPLDAVTAQWLAMYDYLAAHPWAAKVIAEGHYLAAGARPVVGHGLALLRPGRAGRGRRGTGLPRALAPGARPPAQRAPLRRP